MHQLHLNISRLHMAPCCMKKGQMPSVVLHAPGSALSLQDTVCDQAEQSKQAHH